MIVWPLWLALSLGGMGVYFRLIAGRASSHRALGWWGAVLGGVSLVFLAVLAWQTGESWPAPTRMARGPRIGWLVLLECGLFAAGAAITSRRRASAGCWFALSVAITAALSLWLGAHAVGLLALTVALCGFAFTTWWLAWAAPWYREARVQDEAGTPGEHEPWLACVAAVLLAGALAGAARGVPVAEHREHAGRRRGMLPEPESPPAVSERLHHSLHAGALLIALGGIGFSARRGDSHLAIASVVAFEGILLTCAAWAAPQSRSAGEALAIAGVVVVALQTAAVAILSRARGPHGCR